MNNKMNNKKLVATLLLAVACFIWSAEFILIDIALADLPTAFFTMLRLGAAALTLWLYRRLSERGSRKENISKKDHILIGLSGAIGMGMYYYLENVGIAHTSGALASLLLTIVPILGLLSDRIFFHNKITKVKAVAAAVSMGGVFLIVLGGNADGLAGSFKGYAAMLGAVVFWTGYLTISQPLLKRLSPATLVSKQTIWAFVISVPMAFTDAPDLSTVPKTSLLLAFLIGACCTAGAGLVYTFALVHIRVSFAALSENFIPVLAVLMELLVFHTLPSPMQIAGGVIIIVSVLFASGMISFPESRNKGRGIDGDDRYNSFEEQKTIPKQVLPIKIGKAAGGLAIESPEQERIAKIRVEEKEESKGDTIMTNDNTKTRRRLVNSMSPCHRGNYGPRVLYTLRVLAKEQKKQEKEELKGDIIMTNDNTKTRRRLVNSMSPCHRGNYGPRVLYTRSVLAEGQRKPEKEEKPAGTRLSAQPQNS